MSTDLRDYIGGNGTVLRVTSYAGPEHDRRRVQLTFPHTKRYCQLAEIAVGRLRDRLVMYLNADRCVEWTTPYSYAEGSHRLNCTFRPAEEIVTLAIDGCPVILSDVQAEDLHSILDARLETGLDASDATAADVDDVDDVEFTLMRLTFDGSFQEATNL